MLIRDVEEGNPDCLSTTVGRRGIYNTRGRRRFRKRLRNRSTAAEAVLWRYLKNRQLGGWKFRRQHSVGPYILDFYCAEARLAVELDGAGHFGFAGPEHDARRTEWLAGQGIRLIRFENKVVFDNLDFMLERIRTSLLALPSS